MQKHREKRKRRSPSCVIDLERGLVCQEAQGTQNLRAWLLSAATNWRLLHCQHWHWISLGREGSVGHPGYRSWKTWFVAGPHLPLSAVPSPAVPLQSRLCPVLLQLYRNLTEPFRSVGESHLLYSIAGWLRSGGSIFLWKHDQTGVPHCSICPIQM